MRFRHNGITLIADIESMFHLVKVLPQVAQVLRFLRWPKGDISVDPRSCCSPNVGPFAWRYFKVARNEEFCSNSIPKLKPLFLFRSIPKF